MRYFEEPNFGLKFITYPKALEVACGIMRGFSRFEHETQMVPIAYLAREAGVDVAEASAVALQMVKHGLLLQDKHPNPAKGLHFKLTSRGIQYPVGNITMDGYRVPEGAQRQLGFSNGGILIGGDQGDVRANDAQNEDDESGATLYFVTLHSSLLEMTYEEARSIACDVIQNAWDSIQGDIFYPEK